MLSETETAEVLRGISKDLRVEEKERPPDVQPETVERRKRGKPSRDLIDATKALL